jgi:NADP-dependent 3-hydroxy acid dehydrogenase YdfG
MIITGNDKFGLAAELKKLYPDAIMISREAGYDLSTTKDRNRLAELSLEHDTFINCSALFKFNQTLVLESVYKKCLEQHHNIKILSIGSTTDRVKKGTSWLYNAEKKALRDYSNSLALLGTWGDGPKVSLISFGSLSNVQEKHPDRTCLAIERAASYVKWVLDQPFDININEISVDPIQMVL